MRVKEKPAKVTARVRLFQTKPGTPVMDTVKAPETDANASTCSAVCGQSVCERKPGHSGKHLDAGVMWTDAGAARIQKEIELEATK